MKVFISFCAAGVLLSLAGCGGGAAGGSQVAVVPVKGKLYVDDKPYGPAVLTLIPEQGEATSTEGGKQLPTVGGKVAEDGTFTLTTYTEGDGAPPGAYTLQVGKASSGGDPTVDAAALMGAAGGGGVEPAKVTIPPEGSENLEIHAKSGGKGGSAKPGAPLGAPVGGP